MRDPLPIDTDFLTRCIDTLESASDEVQRRGSDDAFYDIFQAAAVKEFEIILHQLEGGSGLCFPSPLRPGRMLSDMTLTNILRKSGLTDRATVHGFRTSFKTWTMEQTDAPWAGGEAALAHQLGGSVEQAYVRSDLFDRRRVLMQGWADYLAA